MDQAVVEERIQQFVAFKLENGQVPFTAFGEDKPSGVNRTGEVIRAFQDDNHWHCHLGSSGDPMIAYRVLAPNHIRLICATTHRQNFAERKTFIQNYASEFPKTMKRRPALGRKK